MGGPGMATILIEAEERHRPGAVAATRHLLDPLGYEGFFVDADTIRPMLQRGRRAA